MVSLKKIFSKQEKETKKEAEGYTTQSQIGGVHKAFVNSDFLYRPPFGYPRNVDIERLRNLARIPHINLAIQTVIDQVASSEWDIVPKERDEPGFMSDDEQKLRIRAVKDFFYNPNGNDESFESLVRSAVRDILEVDAGLWVKVYNLKGKLVELYARDGGVFLKNPDIYGVMSKRADFVGSPSFDIRDDSYTRAQQYFREEAAYFQYGWTISAPIPFGKKEIVYMMRNPRSDNIYGRSPIEILDNILLTLLYGADYNNSFYINNNMPDGIVSIMNADADVIESFKTRMEKSILTQDSFGNKLKKWFKVPVTNLETKFTPFQLKPVDMQILEQQLWFAKIAWSLLGVTPSELGFTEDSNRAVDQNQSKVNKRRSIKPILNVLAYHINTQIMPDLNPEEDLEFRFKEYDLDEDIKKTSLAQMHLNMGIRTKEEIREELGFGQMPQELIEKNKTDEEAKKAAQNQFPKAEEKALLTRQPVALGMGEELGKADLRNELIDYLKEEEKKLLESIRQEYHNNTLAQVKSNDIRLERLLSKVNQTISSVVLRDLVSKVTKNVYYKGLEDAEKEVGLNFFPDQNTLKTLENYNYELVKNMTEELKNKLKTSLQRAHLNNSSYSTTIQEVKSIFSSTEDRARSIVVTEMGRAQNIGRLEGAKQSRVEKGKSVVNYMDDKTSPLCKRMIHKYGEKTIGLNEMFTDENTGQSWLTPPFHVQCRTKLTTPLMENS